MRKKHPPETFYSKILFEEQIPPAGDKHRQGYPVLFMGSTGVGFKRYVVSAFLIITGPIRPETVSSSFLT